MNSLPTQPPVIILTGPVGHGKTTAREILVKLTGLRGGSCSDIIYNFLAFRRNTTVEELRKIPKEELRPALIEAGDFMCGEIGKLIEQPINTNVDSLLYRIPSALIRTQYHNGRNIIDGVRRTLELQDAKYCLSWNGVRTLVIWIENPRVDISKDNTEVKLKEMVDEIVLNDGTPEDLEKVLKLILEKHFGKQDGPPAPAMEVIDMTGDKK